MRPGGHGIFGRQAQSAHLGVAAFVMLFASGLLIYQVMISDGKVEG